MSNPKSMKKDKGKTTAPPAATPPATGKNRTVKVSDGLHHRIRVLSVQRRIPMQSFIEQVLEFGLKNKVYENFEVAA